MLRIREHSLGMKPKAGLYPFPPEFNLCTQCQSGAAADFPALLPPPINPSNARPSNARPALAACLMQEAGANKLHTTCGQSPSLRKRVRKAYTLTFSHLSLTNELRPSPPGRGIGKRSRNKDADVSKER